MKRHRLFTALLSALLLFTSALISCGKEDTAENETTLAETEEAHPLVLEAVIDLLRAERREYRVRLVFLIPFFLDMLPDLTSKY